MRSTNILISLRQGLLGGVLALFALMGAQAPVQAEQPDAAVVIASGPAGSIHALEFEAAAEELLPPLDRVGMWAASGAPERFARSLYATRVLAARAEALGMGTDITEVGTVRERSLARRYLEQQVQQAMPDEQAIKRFARSELLAAPERFVQPETVHVRHILLRDGAETGSQEGVPAALQHWLDELEAGADFATLAREQSQDPGSAARGGELPAFERGRVAPDFEQAAFALRQPGERSAPVRTAFGWHLIELIEYTPEKPMEIAQVEQRVRDDLERRLNARVRGELWDEAGAEMEVNQPELDRLVLKHTAGLLKQRP